MISASFKDSSPVVKILFSLFAIVVGFTVFSMIGIFFASIFYGAGNDALKGTIDLSKPENIPVMKFLQICFSVGLFVFPPLIISVFVSGKIAEYLKLEKTISFNSLILIILLVFFSVPLINFLMLLNESIRFPESLKGLENVFKNMENEAQKASLAFLKSKSVGQYITNLLVIAIIPAIGEELTFRGIFQRLFHEWSKNIHVAIFISAFLFSAMHFQFYGFFARWFLGIVLGYMFYWSGNLWLPIIAHFLNNASAVTLYYLKGDLALKAENIGKGFDMIQAVLLSTFAVAAIMYMIYRQERKSLKN